MAAGYSIDGMLLSYRHCVIKRRRNNVEHWEVEIELERIAMQANCVRDNHNNSFMVIGIKRPQYSNYTRVRARQS